MPASGSQPTCTPTSAEPRLEVSAEIELGDPVGRIRLQGFAHTR